MGIDSNNSFQKEEKVGPLTGRPIPDRAAVREETDEAIGKTTELAQRLTHKLNLRGMECSIGPAATALANGYMRTAAGIARQHYCDMRDKEKKETRKRIQKLGDMNAKELYARMAEIREQIQAIDERLEEIADERSELEDLKDQYKNGTLDPNDPKTKELMKKYGLTKEDIDSGLFTAIIAQRLADLDKEEDGLRRHKKVLEEEYAIAQDMADGLNRGEPKAEAHKNALVKQANEGNESAKDILDNVAPHLKDVNKAKNIYVEMGLAEQDAKDVVDGGRDGYKVQTVSYEETPDFWSDNKPSHSKPSAQKMGTHASTIESTPIQSAHNLTGTFQGATNPTQTPAQKTENDPAQQNDQTPENEQGTDATATTSYTA